MVIFYKIWKKYNEIQSTKNNKGLSIRKITNISPSPIFFAKRDDRNGQRVACQKLTIIIIQS